MKSILLIALLFSALVSARSEAPKASVDASIGQVLDLISNKEIIGEDGYYGGKCYFYLEGQGKKYFLSVRSDALNGYLPKLKRVPLKLENLQNRTLRSFDESTEVLWPLILKDNFDFQSGEIELEIVHTLFESYARVMFINQFFEGDTLSCIINDVKIPTNMTF